jgi:uncharacterized protein (DUF2267 family)
LTAAVLDASGARALVEGGRNMATKHATTVPPVLLARETFLEEVRTRMLPLEVAPERASTAVLCTLVQRLSSGEASAMLEQLPPGVRALAEACDTHRTSGGGGFHRDEFVRRVGAHLDVHETANQERVTRAVFAGLRRFLQRRELASIGRQLPADLEELWRNATRSPEEEVEEGPGPESDVGPADRTSG